jgi:4-amino-4-deoxy-L-arabinose transferase-like glycosyltransferase
MAFLTEEIKHEWRLPIMLISISGVVFILLTALFGITVDTRSGTVDWSLEPGSDWSNPVIGKSNEDRGHVNPMTQYPWFCFLAMILGYFISLGMFIYIWFGYMKWRVTTSERLRGEQHKKN